MKRVAFITGGSRGIGRAIARPPAGGACLAVHPLCPRGPHKKTIDKCRDTCIILRVLYVCGIQLYFWRLH